MSEIQKRTCLAIVLLNLLCFMMYNNTIHAQTDYCAGIAPLPVTDFQMDTDGTVSFTFNNERTVTFDGRQRGYTQSFEEPDGSLVKESFSYNTVPIDTTVSPSTNSQFGNYQWGTVNIQWLPSADEVDVVVSFTNNTDRPIVNMTFYLNQGDYSFPSEYTDVTGVNSTTGKLSSKVPLEMLRFDDGKGAFIYCVEDAGVEDEISFPSSGIFVRTARIEPGETVDVIGSFRHAPYDVTELEEAACIAPDVMRDFGEYYPHVLDWEDRRNIGVVFNASIGWAPYNTGSTTNLRGWAENQLGSGIDVTTPEGIADLHERLLDQLRRAINNAKGYDWQGLIIWDLEGQEGPHPVSSYVGDPLSIAVSAPEMEVEYKDTGIPFVDYYMNLILEANLKIGITIRPTEVLQSPDWGGSHSNAPWRLRHYRLPDPTDALRRKIQYAIDRWGVTLYYIDTYTEASVGEEGTLYEATGGANLNVDILQQLLTEFPNILLIPENNRQNHICASAPWLSSSFEGGANINSETWRRTIWPDDWAFAVNGRQSQLLPASEEPVKESIMQGDIQLANAWFRGNDQKKLDTLSREYADPQLDLIDLDTLVFNISSADPTDTFSFGRDDRSTPRNSTVDWQIKSLPSEIASASLSMGELVNESDRQTITLTFDLSCMPQDSQHIGRIVFETQGHEIWQEVKVFYTSTGDPLPDADGDGVCDAEDICPGGDDTIDNNSNGIPDACETGCIAIDFRNYPIASFDNSQDKGTATITSDSGEEIVLENNAWKSIEVNYTVTPNTVLSFEFKSTQRGEIHGIGFDNNTTADPEFAYQLYGSQTWGDITYKNYDGSGEYMEYTIPVGESYTGFFPYLFFAMDHDGGSMNGNSFFKNITIYEEVENNITCYVPLNSPACEEQLTLNGSSKDTRTYQTANNSNATDGGLITSAQVIEATARISYNAGTEIILTEGFHAKAGTDFRAYIAGCELAPPAAPAIVEQRNSPVTARLADPQPNPFSDYTTFRYFIPESVQQAELRIVNMYGQSIQVVKIDERREGEYTFNSDVLNAGHYFCFLLLDGEIAEVKKMIRMR